MRFERIQRVAVIIELIRVNSNIPANSGNLRSSERHIRSDKDFLNRSVYVRACIRKIIRSGHGECIASVTTDDRYRVKRVNSQVIDFNIIITSSCIDR